VHWQARPLDGTISGRAKLGKNSARAITKHGQDDQARSLAASVGGSSVALLGLGEEALGMNWRRINLQLSQLRAWGFCPLRRVVNSDLRVWRSFPLGRQGLDVNDSSMIACCGAQPIEGTRQAITRRPT